MLILYSLLDPQTLALMWSKKEGDFAKIVLFASSVAVWQISLMMEHVAESFEKN